MVIRHYKKEKKIKKIQNQVEEKQHREIQSIKKNINQI